MPYTTIVAGTYATAAWANANVRDQVITTFATTTARDAAITAPVEGMVAYIGSNDSSEGLYTYNGSTWRKGPGWNAPWGFMASATSSATFTTSGTTELTIVQTGSFTAISNRYYLITVQTSSYASQSGDIFQIRVRNNSLTGTSLGIVSQSSYSSGGIGYQTNGLSVITTIAAGASAGLFVTAQRISGTGTNTYNHIASPAYVTMTDIGPSGAPA